MKMILTGDPINAKYAKEICKKSAKPAGIYSNLQTSKRKYAMNLSEICMICKVCEESVGICKAICKTVRKYMNYVNFCKKRVQYARNLQKEKLQEIDHENQSLVIENNALKDNSTRSWFLIGAAVLFAGILLGIILPRLKVRKKDSWGSL